MNCVFTKESWQAEIQLASLVPFDSSTMLELNTRCSLWFSHSPKQIGDPDLKVLVFLEVDCYMPLFHIYCFYSYLYLSHWVVLALQNSYIYKMYRDICLCAYTHIIIYNCVCIYVNAFRQVGLWGTGKLKLILLWLFPLSVFWYLTTNLLTFLPVFLVSVFSKFLENKGLNWCGSSLFLLSVMQIKQQVQELLESDSLFIHKLSGHCPTPM